MANHFVGAFSTVFSREFLLNPHPIQQCDNKFIFNV